MIAFIIPREMGGSSKRQSYISLGWRDRFEPHDFISLEAVGIIFVRFSEQGTVGKRRELRQPDVFSQA